MYFLFLFHLGLRFKKDMSVQRTPALQYLQKLLKINYQIP